MKNYYDVVLSEVDKNMDRYDSILITGEFNSEREALDYVRENKSKLLKEYGNPKETTHIYIVDVEEHDECGNLLSLIVE